ncbi:hypothetical protein AMEX_G4015 [Astyanax mexicanus]|uniref:Interleukin-4 n=1 Tax=Astyanax mexicanus TaxID=7994 RepID=A0A8T2MI96_ASTMX|nr:hypothetical protein AMEX_G4015 [Astyanax mexicanus]
MKTLALVLLFIAADATAAPTTTTASEKNLQHVILKEIIHSVKHLNSTLEDKVKKMMVLQAVTHGHCTHENLCKAATVLQELSAETLGLEEKNWLLPRQLVAYTRNIQCKSPAPDHQIQLQDLLQNIHYCAQKMFTKL